MNNQCRQGCPNQVRFGNWRKNRMAAAMVEGSQWVILLLLARKKEQKMKWS